MSNVKAGAPAEASAKAGEAGDDRKLDTSRHSEGGSTSHPLQSRSSSEAVAHHLTASPELHEIRLIADHMDRELERMRELLDRLCPAGREDRSDAQVDPHAPGPTGGQGGRAG